MFGFHDIDLTVFWGAIVLIVFMSFLFGYLRRLSKYRMIERLAEKGQTLSPELLASVSNGNGHDDRHRSPIQSGIFLMCAGIAIAVFFWAMNGGGGVFGHPSGPYWLPVIGIFPFAVGFARVLGMAFERRPPK
jgi:hypothetical protein